jgi:amyloid beta precursor protein binding protein 1
VDVQAVRHHVQQHLTRLNLPLSRINDEEIAAFCKHAAFLQVIRYRSLVDEYITDPPTARLSKLRFYIQFIQLILNLHN